MKTLEQIIFDKDNDKEAGMIPPKDVLVYFIERECDVLLNEFFNKKPYRHFKQKKFDEMNDIMRLLISDSMYHFIQTLLVENNVMSRDDFWEDTTLEQNVSKMIRALKDTKDCHLFWIL